MSTKLIPFRLDKEKLDLLDSKLNGMKRQTFFAKCVELFIEGKLSIDTELDNNDSSKLSNDSSEIMELKKQIAIIVERLDRIENDSKMIAFDTTITDTELDNNDSSKLSNDSLSIQSDTDTDTDKEDNTASIALSECPVMPVNEDLGVNVPETKMPSNEVISSDDTTDKKEGSNEDKFRKFASTVASGEKFSTKQLSEKTGIESSWFSKNKNIISEYFVIEGEGRQAKTYTVK